MEDGPSLDDIASEKAHNAPILSLSAPGRQPHGRAAAAGGSDVGAPRLHGAGLRAAQRDPVTRPPSSRPTPTLDPPCSPHSYL